MAKYTLMKTEGRAKRAQFETVHGTIQTPVFMNVGTIGAIKGAVSTQDLYVPPMERPYMPVRLL